MLCFFVETFTVNARQTVHPGWIKPDKYDAYLFAYFTGNSGGQEAIHYALSYDGFDFRALNNNAAIISSSLISSTGGVRDPHVLRGIDGKSFFMVATDMNVAKNGWGPNYAMVLMKSTDLIHWSSVVVDMKKNFSTLNNVNRVWAPQTIYDPHQKKYMIYWAMRFGAEADKIYYAYANKDFTGLETAPKQLFFNPSGGACIDADIIEKEGRYHLFFKTEGAGAGIKAAVSNTLTEGYQLQEGFKQQTTDPVEGSCVYKLNNGEGYVLMYDVYTKGRYEFTFSKDLEKFRAGDKKVSMNFSPRHGTVISITKKEADMLEHNNWQTSALPAVKLPDGYNNPVLKGLYADPEILYSRRDRKVYLYPTSDGFVNWSGTYFKAFSSMDMVNWKDEGIILDLKKDVSWAHNNAWAPCVIEKKTGNSYKYYYYYCADKKIGVATADSPTGPFTDSGRPIVADRPKGTSGGQQIDPSVFTDPETGKSYLYWGNGYMAVAELNDDMITLKPETTKLITPSASFREGAYVFYRNGKYYFMSPLMIPEARIIMSVMGFPIARPAL